MFSGRVGGGEPKGPWIQKVSPPKNAKEFDREVGLGEEAAAVEEKEEEGEWELEEVEMSSGE